MTKRKLAIYLLLAVGFILLLTLSPDLAFAEEEKIGFSQVMQKLQVLVATLLLPLGIIVAAWRMIYLALVCGLIGTDPLNMVGGGEEINAQDVKEEMKKSFKGFIKGLCWVGGIFIVFEFAVGIAATLAQTVSASFG